MPTRARKRNTREQNRLALMNDGGYPVSGVIGMVGSVANGRTQAPSRWVATWPFEKADPV